MIPCLLLLLALASAQGPDPAAVARAEADRLTFQVHQYADRQVWTAVERTYTSALETGVPLAAEVHQLGAHAARDRGDMNAVHTRLLAALAVESTNEVIEELWNLTQTYGTVDLRGVELVAVRRPFDPVQARALDHAVQQLASAGHYAGLLPRGNYTLDGVEFHLLLGRPSVELTTTTKKPATSSRERRPRAAEAR